MAQKEVRDGDVEQRVRVVPGELDRPLIELGDAWGLSVDHRGAGYSHGEILVEDDVVPPVHDVVGVVQLAVGETQALAHLHDPVLAVVRAHQVFDELRVELSRDAVQYRGLDRRVPPEAMQVVLQVHGVPRTAVLADLAHHVADVWVLRHPCFEWWQRALADQLAKHRCLARCLLRPGHRQTEDPDREQSGERHRKLETASHNDLLVPQTALRRRNGVYILDWIEHEPRSVNRLPAIAAKAAAMRSRRAGSRQGDPMLTGLVIR